ncbi:DNA polymerase [Paramuricea clavata]|uniref:DNA-directed DNA polymerase n=1 Tax=Paramuricea clavata TaxID=317549 RepID=A0A6S7HC04_PARCT|nr:DNA polymerase [Paramuricea clavata]
MCLARALVVAKAKIDNDTRDRLIRDHRRPLQKRLARELHQNAGVSLGSCGMDEVKQFQTYLSDYQINIVSKEHQHSILYSEYIRTGNHGCYMQPVKKRNTTEDLPDSEPDEEDLLDNEPDDVANCRQENSNHEPNLCLLQNEAGDERVFEGDNTRNEFCEWLFTKEHAGCTVMAHNFQGYDSYFILQYLRENGVKYDVIMRGAKVYRLLELYPNEGYFPHLYNKKENEHYVGPLPPSPYYNPDGMNPDEKEKFLEWHNELKQNNYVFNFQQEILSYCRSDVDILRRCCLEFRELFRDVTDIDPFEKCLTIASACNLVYRTNLLEEDTIAIIPPHGYRPKVKQSNIALKWLSYTAEKNDIFVQHKRSGGEKSVGRYFPDGYHEETNTAYEFHGCFWHGCLNCYARGTVNPVTGKTMHNLYMATVEKTSYLREGGFNVIEMWECELKRELEQDEDMRSYFDNYKLIDPLESREAFFGGRTNAAKLYHQCEEDEKVRYVDFTSLYPWASKMTRTIVGHPRIITVNFDEDISTYFGLIKCTVLPPRGLFHPVLPYRAQGKLMFHLRRTCADTCDQNTCTHSDNEKAIQGIWCSVELDKALKKRYRILQLHEVWHFPETSDELFKDYIDTFLQIKQEASGYPNDCVTEEQKQQYVDGYLEVEEIRLDPNKIEYNLGMRALAKLMLNSFWGKFAQRPNMAKNLTDYSRPAGYTENFIAPNAKTNVVIAAFTTAYARLKLYEVLDVLQEKVLYYETDSVIFVSKPDDPEPPTGSYLGQLTDELKGDHITTFISGGPKNYCYRTNTNKVKTKIRGITLNCTAKQKVNFDVIRALVFLHAKCHVTGQVSVDIPFKITRNTKSKNIETKRMKKDYRIVYNKRIIIDDYKTIPYGY